MHKSGLPGTVFIQVIKITLGGAAEGGAAKGDVGIAFGRFDSILVGIAHPIGLVSWPGPMLRKHKFVFI